MDASPVRLPAGVRDYLPRAAARRRAIAERLLALFERWGYQRIITPVYECADVLERGLGDAGRAEAIRFVEPGSAEVVALRPDFTPQIARIAATRMHDVDGPLRLCYEGAVHRLAAGL
ncbi:MAG: ATP phosphoribosyltransferase regulatory subunit, partial [Myxococcales bacterium]|nr:ATP phosphoribosyltransferase regulatory subunit [Myxococcales bacterium]